MGNLYSRLWFRRFKPADPDAVTLICLPHAGGVAGCFYDLATLLSPQVQVLGVQYPGRQDRLGEAPFRDAGALADAIGGGMPISAIGAVALLGHSYGAILAYEIARRLDERGASPRHVFLSAHGPQNAPRAYPTHALEDDAFLTAVRNLGGQGNDLLGDPALAELVLPSLRADLFAAETYAIRGGWQMSSSISALFGKDDRRAPERDVDGWRAFAAAGYDLRGFDGGHLYFLNSAQPLASYIASRLF